MAMIQFPEGQGEVGRSVYQRLRECKKLHEYSWPDSLLFDETSKRTLTKRERGHRLNDQRANTVADIAAVLGGLGKGNKIVVSTADATEGESRDASVTGEGQAQTQAQGEELVKTEDGKTLVQATVWWSNALDRNYAKAWPKNVRHELFEEAVLEPNAAKLALDAKERESQTAPAELVTEQELTKGAERSQTL
jgi:hypothetical protein